MNSLQSYSVTPKSLMVNEPVLCAGDKGEAVKELQTLLNAKGASLKVDGLFGTATLNALIHFQQNQGLEVDGIVDLLTWAELRRKQPPIRLVNVCRYYNPSSYPHQTAALEWLQSQLPPEVLSEFTKRWRNQP